MADADRRGESETLGAPLLDPAPARPLDLSLRRLESFLSRLGYNTVSSDSTAGSATLRLLLSGSAFALWGVAAPAAAFVLSRCRGCALYHVESFELCALVTEASLAAISLVCVSRNLYKYGIRKFLFVDRHHGEVDKFQEEYVKKIQDFFRLLFWWILPCFIIKTAREITRSISIIHDSIWRAAAIFLASLLSWVYTTMIFLSACALFNTVFNLQVIHFNEYCKLLERDLDTMVFLEEHFRLRYHLSKISHRFRIFLLLLFVFIPTSQCVILFQTTGYSEMVNFANAGNLLVCSIVQVVGVVLCLHSAAKITHRAQGVSSVAAKWHAVITSGSTDSGQPRLMNGSGNLEAPSVISVVTDYSESDLESLDSVTLHTNAQFSYMSSYHKRQALVMYLQTNPGGITIFGWAVDRTLINTIFFVELSLVLFVLGKTIVLAK